MDKAFNFYIPLKKDVMSGSDLIGVASTLSVDRDTEKMSERALRMMVNDIKTVGVNLFGNHEHNWENTLGAVKDAELVDNEVKIKINLDDATTNPKIPALLNKLKRGIKLGLSVGGSVISDKWEYDKEVGKKVKVIDGVKLYEISVVGIPSNPDSFVSIPSAIAKSRKVKKARKQRVTVNLKGKRFAVVVEIESDGERHYDVTYADGSELEDDDIPLTDDIIGRADEMVKSIEPKKVEEQIVPEEKQCPICYGKVVNKTCKMCFYHEEQQFTKATSVMCPLCNLPTGYVSHPIKCHNCGYVEEEKMKKGKKIGRYEIVQVQTINGDQFVVYEGEQRVKIFLNEKEAEAWAESAEHGNVNKAAAKYNAGDKCPRCGKGKLKDDTLSHTIGCDNEKCDFAHYYGDKTVKTAPSLAEDKMKYLEVGASDLFQRKYAELNAEQQSDVAEYVSQKFGKSMFFREQHTYDEVTVAYEKALDRMTTKCPFCTGPSMEVKMEMENKQNKAYQCAKCGQRFIDDNLSKKEKFSKRTHSARWDRCVEEVRSRGGVDSPEAVCTAQLGEESYE